MKLTMFNPTGAWVAVASVLSSSQDGRRGPLAFDPLRRPRIHKRPSGPDASPRTWLGRLRLERLQIVLPAQSPTAVVTVLDLAFNPTIAPLACVLDDPAAETRSATDYETAQLSLVTASLDRAVTLSQGAAWASWVDRAVAYPSADGWLRTPGAAPAGAKVITVAEVFAMLGMAAPDAASGLQVDVDGLVVAGARAVPWWDPGLTAADKTASPAQRPMPGLFRLAIDPGAPPGRRYRLIAERSPQWANSLRRYQAAVVDATAARLDVQGLPEPGSPAVGLSAAPLPPEIAWYLDATGWVFTPGASLFEIELRGVAGGIASWAPASIRIAASGAQLTCTSSTAAADPDAITYDYAASGDKQWSGDFAVAPDPDDLLLTLSTLSVDGGAQADAIWLITETGAFHLPVDRPAPSAIGDRDTSQRLLRGVFHLAEVPWRAPDSAAGAGPLAPDFQGASLTRLMLTDAGQIEAAFAFAVAGGALSCTSIHAVLRDPRLRLEDFVPPYVPPRALRAQALSGPPPAPDPGHGEGPSSFLGLSFVRGRVPTTAATANAWRVHLRFRPGRVGQTPAMEGDWRDTSLEVRLPPANAARALYWFRPAGLRWIPSLPLYGDPRLDPDHRLCAERTYLPLQPRANEPITFGLGDDWPISVLQRGSFSAPEAAGPPVDGPPAFTWIAPELPGMALALMPGEPLAIESGRPAGGRVRWLIRHGLPIQDELYALRALKEPGKPGSPAAAPPLDGPDWWRALTLLVALAQSQREILADAPIAFTPGAVVAVTDQPVALQNLYAGQTFAGIASLHAIPPRASVDLALPGGGRRSLIAAERLLEGASARFTVNAVDPASSPVLAPSADPAAPIQLRAGSLVPQVVDVGNQRMFFDQVGRVSFSLPDVPGRGRLTRVPVAAAAGSPAPASPVATCFQWSHPGLDLSSANVALGLYFAALPLERRGASWVFDAASAGEQDPVLRDFRWGTLGRCLLWGLRFQVMTLERIELPTDAVSEPGLPARIVLAGVLHFLDASIRSADDATQGVRLTLRRDADRWSIEALDGRFLWPLFEPTPDLADATRPRLTDPLPWLEGKVSLVADAAGQALALGTPDQPSQLVFQFLGRTWSLPVALAAGKVTSSLEAANLPWRIVAAAAPPGTLAALDGQVTLGRPGQDPRPSSAATVRFHLAIPLAPSQTHVLADLILALRIAPDGPRVTLDRVSLLSSGASAILTVEGPQVGQVDLTAQQVSLAIDRPPGDHRDAAPFELLPGWPRAADAALQAYLSLRFVPPSAELVALSVGVEELQLLIETTLAPPAPAPAPRLQVLLVAALRPPAAPQVSIQLTGQLHAANQIAWSAPGGETVRHTALFTLRQATLPGDRLVATAARAFFAPRAMTTDEDPSGLGGMIELPALASHRLVASGPAGEREVAAWVAPQRLRLGAPASFLEEIVLRGTKQVDLRVPGLPRVIDGLLALYRFDDGTGTTVHDRSGAAAPLDLAISSRDAVQWTATGLTVRSPALLASPQAATGLIDALRATGEVTFEAWLKTPEPNRRDPATLFALAVDHDDGVLSVELRWDQDHGRPASFHRVTLRTSSDDDKGKDKDKDKDKDSKGKDQTGTLDSPAGALTAELSHLVFTRDASGMAILYVDGVERARKPLPGRFSSWDRQARFALANGLKNNEPWLGELRLVAVYQRALTAAEVRRNFQALDRPASRVLAENGFAGPLGDALADALRKAAATTDTMIVEASEAFWLRFQAADSTPAVGTTRPAGRDPAVLWRDGRWTLAGLPTAESDFFPLNTATVHDWLRLPLPLLTDTAGVIGQSKDLVKALQCALPDPAQPPPQVEGQPLVSREALLHRAMLDQYSLHHRPPHPGFGDPVDQVLLSPDAWERLLPYTRLLPGFAPGWLVFADWPARSRADGVAGPPPFAAASDALGRLASPGRPPGSWLAATEATPDVTSAELPWQQLIGPDGPRPYLLASPLVAIQQTLAQDPVPAAPEVELRILLEAWVPASGGGAGAAGVQPVLAARSVFRLAVAPDDNWTTVLFTGPAGGQPESPLRARVRDWVTQASATLFSTLTPLLRATALTPSALPPKAYFLLARQDTATGQRPVKRGVFGSRGQLRPDLRFEALSGPLALDPLGLGPDYLGGQVYYERRTWFEPPAPVLDNLTLAPPAAIDSLTVEPAVSNLGQPVTFRWTTHGADLSLRLGVKDQDDFLDVTGQTSRTVVPQRTGVYVLRALSGSKQVDAREVAVVVRVPAAGSAVGLAYKLAGTAAGPAHPSRLPWSDPGANHHRWVEALRDLMFLDLTRADRASHDEPGRFLPSTRRLDWGPAPDRRALRPFLPTRAVQLFTSGRPGGFLRLRTALLDEDNLGMLRRSASLAHELRHPRPVPLPPELFPFDPAQPVDADHPAPRRTCGVAALPGPAPFRFARLTWQDPIFNRRLLAVGQEVTANKLVLGLDRAIYAGVDVMYPEVRFIPEVAGWSLAFTISLYRKDATTSYKLGDVTYQATDAAVTKTGGLQSRGELRGIRRAATPGGVRRWVWEIGLNQPAVLENTGADNDNFEITLQNYDEVRVTARLLDPSGKELQRLQLTGTVRTDVEVWPQPQNAFGILRTGPGGSGATGAQTDLVAFGWLPKPRVIKRGDRFNPDSWAGTFTHIDARVSAADTPAAYEVLSFTADGEQAMPDDGDVH